MERLFQVIRNTQKLNPGELFVRLFSQPDNQRLIIQLNQKNQLFEQGVDSLNRIIGTYSPTTEILSGGLKKAGQHYTLLDTGRFYESFRITNVNENDLTIDGDDSHFNDQEWFTVEIYGLTDESKDLLIKSILSEFRFLTLQKILG